jgi:hypothetical protein
MQLHFASSLNGFVVLARSITLMARFISSVPAASGCNERIVPRGQFKSPQGEPQSFSKQPYEGFRAELVVSSFW